MRQEISRHTPLGQKAAAGQKRGQPLVDETTLALMRRWFWTRKPDAGFVLTDFPATLLQAKVFDEWLDARDESIDAVIEGADSRDTAARLVLNHYREHGLPIVIDEALRAVCAD